MRNKSYILKKLRLDSGYDYVGTASTYERNFRPFEFDGKKAGFCQALSILFKEMAGRPDTLLIPPCNIKTGS